MPTGPTSYSEYLRVPLRWWVQATMFLATVWIAFIVSTPAWVAWTVSLSLLALTFALMFWVGSARVAVREGWLQAGPARVETRYVGEVTALDRDAARELLGVGADVRAYLLMRPYLKQAVKVQITDPRDPTPYWVVASRHPRELAQALDADRPSGDAARVAGPG